MNQKYFYTDFFAGIVIVFLTLVYILFPSENCSADALCYAADGRYGNNLFQPHHLLYTYFNHVLYRWVSAFAEVDALHFMAFVNSLFAGAGLWVLYKLLGLRQQCLSPLLGTLLLGCSFGYMRFSVEAEAYIIPLFFSLLASYGYCRHITTGRQFPLVGMSVAAAVSVLFHQLYLFWMGALFVGLFIYSKRSALVFSLFSLFVPATYMAVIVLHEALPCSLNSLWHYLASYYYSGEGHLSVTAVNLLLTPISFFRTFVQVHGSLMHFTGIVFSIVLLGVVSLVLAVCAFRSWRFFKPSYNRELLFEWTMGAAFLLQLFFAFLSDGNAEFMVMLPALFVLAFPAFAAERSPLYRTVFVGCCFLWNMVVAIVPQHVLNYYNTQAVVKFVNEKGNCRFLPADYYTTVNRNYYETGVDLDARFIRHEDASLPDSLFNDNVPLYSDVRAYPALYSRAAFVAQKQDKYDIICFKPVFSFYGAWGEYKIDSLSIRKQTFEITN